MRLIEDKRVVFGKGENQIILKVLEIELNYQNLRETFRGTFDETLQKAEENCH